MQFAYTIVQIALCSALFRHSKFMLYYCGLIHNTRNNGTEF